MKKIEAKIVADSIDFAGNRITSYLLTYPRFIHGELMTHRVFSRNSASSRAIPFNKMVSMVTEDPFIPIAWQKDHKGMQGVEYFTSKKDIVEKEMYWLTASKSAINMAQKLNNHGTTKQLCNRLLEPFMWHTSLVTSTELSNFFELRCPKYEVKGLACGPQKSKKDWLNHMRFSSMLHPSQYPKTTEEWLQISSSGAEIHIQALAEAMWDAKNESSPKELHPGAWHVPFGDQMDEGKLEDIGCPIPFDYNPGRIEMARRAIATARCARLSYMTFEGEINYEKDIELHDILLKAKHLSPFEHCARAMSKDEYMMYSHTWPGEADTIEEASGNEVSIDAKQGTYTMQRGWCNNFRGFIPYRFFLENEKIH